MEVTDKDAALALTRMVEWRCSPAGALSPYFTSYLYIRDSRTVREWLQANGIERKFTLYGDNITREEK